MNPKRYPRLRIWRAASPALYEVTPSWRVGLYVEAGRCARSWWAYDYAHALLMAPAIWTDRDQLLTSRGAR